MFALKISENQFCFFYISPKLPSENIYLERLPGVAEVSPSPARFFGAAFCLGSDLAFALDLPAGCGVLAAAFKSFVASLGGAGDGDHWGKTRDRVGGEDHVYSFTLTKYHQDT